MPDAADGEVGMAEWNGSGEEGYELNASR